MPSEQPPTRVGKIIGICRNPSEPFYWDADRIGEPCPNACHTFYDDDGEDVPYPHEFYVQVDSAPPSEQPREGTRVEWRCSHCKEPVSGPNEFCGGKFGDKDHPPMARPERVSLDPASPTPTEQGEARADGNR